MGKISFAGEGEGVNWCNPQWRSRFYSACSVGLMGHSASTTIHEHLLIGSLDSGMNVVRMGWGEMEMRCMMLLHVSWLKMFWNELNEYSFVLCGLIRATAVRRQL